ncbi:MAG: hypothetical protein FWC03_02440 [Treponema sp.]|nr:hypothetical protein [Treponema sp.]
MFFKKNDKTADMFWQEFEEQTGEKVLSRGLGKYISGWDEFDANKWNDIWGLLITTSGGFHFHHFPQVSWMTALTSFSSVKQPKEKKIFIPKDKIISAQLNKETKWWKRIFSNSAPHFVIRYNDTGSQEKRVVFEAEYKIG